MKPVRNKKARLIIAMLLVLLFLLILPYPHDSSKTPEAFKENFAKKTFQQVNKRESASCLQFPTPDDLMVHNEYWQLLEHDYNVYLYSAHLDKRWNVPTVRILLAFDREVPNMDDFHCLLWYKDQDRPKIVKKLNRPIKLWISKTSPNDTSTFVLSCPVRSKKNKVPLAVSLALKSDIETCDKVVSNALTVENDEGHEKKESFAVCLKAMTLTDPSIVPRLVEWLELLLILGVQRIFFYYIEVHEDVLELLNYYEAKGFVAPKKTSWAGSRSRDDMLQILHGNDRRLVFFKQENLPRTDCFLRERHNYDYIAFLDTDEVIMPSQYENWHELIDKLEVLSVDGNFTHFAFRNTYFFDEGRNATSNENVPEYMHMLRTTERSRHSTGSTSPKCIVKTDSKVMAAFPHHPKCSSSDTCKAFWVNSSLAISAHYRRDCQPSIIRSGRCKKMKQDVIQDRGIERFQDRLVESVKDVLSQLKY